MKALFILTLILLFCLPAYAVNYDSYSDTVQTLFNRLDINDIEKTDKRDKPEKTPDNDELLSDEPEVTYNTESTHSEKDQDEVYHINPVPKSFEGSILERVQSGNTVSLKDMTDGVDKFSTSFYNTITKSLIGLMPILLVIGAIMVLFSRGRAVGAILLVGIGLFAIFNAPELIQVFLNFIMGIFR